MKLDSVFQKENYIIKYIDVSPIEGEVSVMRTPINLNKANIFLKWFFWMFIKIKKGEDALLVNNLDLFILKLFQMVMIHILDQ